MAAAYAALCSILHTIAQIERHPRPPIHLDKEQLQSLTEKVTFLREFLEAYPPITRNEERERLECRIAGAAYMAEDIVESHVVDQIQDGNYGENIISVEFYRGLQRAIEDLDVIKLEVMEIKAKMGGAQHQRLQRNSSSMVTSFSTSSTVSVTKNTTMSMSMVGFDAVLLELLNKLDDGQLERQIIPIVGMGGIGKTTLARHVYAHPFIKERFDICAWVKISQEYDAREILDELLRETNLDNGDSSENYENEKGEVLRKYLFGRRYLIIMDDMWSIDAWDSVKFLFPYCYNGSRIVVTTRLSDLARQLPNSFGVIDMKFLDKDKSWDLFSNIVFPEEGEGCPPELEEIGKKIVWSCGGLPLSVVVVGGILAKSAFERDYWKHIEENLSSIVNSENDEQCLKILEMSYNQLPVHLKPCFLYFGFYREYFIIPVLYMIHLWVAEGFIKPDLASVSGKSLEEIGEEYVKDLVDRNLISVHKLRYTTKRIKKINIHDQVKDLCLRQAQREKFYNVVRRPSAGIPHSQRRLVINDGILEENVQHALLSMPLARSLLSYNEEVVPSPHHRLLRILEASDANLDFYDCRFLENQLVNLRLAFVRNIPRNPNSASTMHLLWNLQTLIIKDNYDGGFSLQDGFWNMPHLRFVWVTPCVYLSNPPSCQDDHELVLENLQTLTDVTNFKCGEEVVKRIPNVNLLAVNILTVDDEGCSDHFDLTNLDQLHKLESFICTSFVPVDLSFPRSLKKLILHFDYCCEYYWDDILEKIGSLPLLQKLILHKGSFRTHEWETVEGQFPSLRVLKLRECGDLKCWTSESSHFPRLERLVLDRLGWLNEIPSGFGEIETLQSIVLKFCSESVVVSAKRVQDEQEEVYGEVGLRVRVVIFYEQYEAHKDLASSNFEIISGITSCREDITKFYQHLEEMRQDLLEETRDGDSSDQDAEEQLKVVS